MGIRAGITRIFADLQAAIMNDAASRQDCPGTIDPGLLLDFLMSGAGPNVISQTLSDVFSGQADGAYSGDSSSGHTRAFTGTGTLSLLGGRLVVNTVGSAYAQAELDSTPIEMGGVVSWATGGGAVASAATLVCGDSQLIIGSPASWNALHFTMSNVSWLMQIVVAGVFTTLGTAPLAGLIDGGPKPVWMQISGNTVTFQTPDGVVQSITDSRIGALVNKYVIYELGNGATGPLVRWESVYAKESIPTTGLIANLLGATKRFRSTLRINKILLDRGIAFADVLTNLYVLSLNTMKTDGVFNAALGFVSGTNYDAAGNLKVGKATETYSASITPNYGLGEWHTVPVANATAFTINAPSSPPSSSRSGHLTIEVLNSSGGAMGAITWDPAFKFAGLTWTNPANTLKRAAMFRWNGTNWICMAITPADY